MAFPGMTAAIGGLKAHMTAMNVIGNNIANVDTPSFKSGDVSFRDTMYQDVSSGAGGGTSGAGVNPSQIGYGAQASGVVTDQTKGAPNATGRASDQYIDGEGYFIVGDTAKDASDKFTGYKYTRIGQLTTDNNGYLTDGNGQYICGYANGSTALTALHLPLTGTVVDSVKNLAIGSDGTITCTDGGTVKTIGKIGLASFTNPAGMEQIGNGYYKPSQNAGVESDTTPGAGNTGSLVSGEIEASNVDLASQFSNMIMYERGYQANTKIVSVYDEMYQTLVNMK